MTEIETSKKDNSENISLFVRTDKHFISELPRFMYTGLIKTIIGEAEAERAVSVLRKNRILGIDTETRPSFHKGESHKVALLQISTEDICFLFRLNRLGFPKCIIDLLSDESILKVGLSLKDDFHMLRARHDFTPKGFIDLQNFVKEMGIEDMSLQKLYANIFHMRISKNARLSNWEANDLTEQQQRYAATDAYACLKLYEKLCRLKENGNYTLDKSSAPDTALEC